MRASPRIPERTGGIELVSLAIVVVVAAVIVGCGSGAEPFDPEYAVKCACEEPLIDGEREGDDGDRHQKFDLTLSIAIEPDPYAPDEAILEQQDFTLKWTVGYDWTPCTEGGKSSTAGSSGEFHLLYALKEGASYVYGPELIPFDLLMGTEEEGSRLIEGVEVPESGLGLIYEAELVFSNLLQQECKWNEWDESDDEVADLLASNNSAFIDFNVEDCPCDGGFNSKTPSISGLVWDGSASQLSWQTGYVIEPCGEDGAGLASGDFLQEVTVMDSAGGVLHRGSVPGTSMTSGDPEDPYTHTIPSDALAGGPYTMEVSLSFPTSAASCLPKSSPTASITVP